MLSLKISILSGVALLSAAALTPSLRADTWDKKTVLTINEAIQLPHTVLQPGTYVFKLADSLSDRHIVQIFNADQSQIIATILAIPNYRLQPTGKSDFRFWETPAGNPKAMRAWFYPGDNFGQEFAYPKMKSIEIARVTKTPVPAIVVDQDTPLPVAELKTVPVVVVDETGKESPVVVAKAEAETQVARNEPAPEAAAEPQATVQAPPQTLPDTASYNPLIALIGLASLAMFALMYFVSNRKPGLMSRVSSRG